MASAQREAVARIRACVLASGVHLPAAPLSLFDREVIVDATTYEITAADGRSLSATEELLLLRYIAEGCEPRPTGELQTFRDLPGGRFYLEPILARTTTMLTRVFRNDVSGLVQAVATLPHRTVGLGDYGLAVRAIGPIELTLVYRLGDEEFPATADLLFDRICARIYRTDEVAALAHLLCRVLISRKPR